MYKNCYNHRKKDHFYGVFRVKVNKETKYLKMLDHLIPGDQGKGFKQEVLNLLA